MSTTNCTKQGWRERWEYKDIQGCIVMRIAFWEDGEPAQYEYRDQRYGVNCVTSDVSRLIPRKPAPVVVPWEPDEVPVGAVVRSKDNPERYGVISDRSGDKFLTIHGWMSCQELYDRCVLHQPKVDTKDCQPCGKVVGK